METLVAFMKNTIPEKHALFKQIRAYIYTTACKKLEDKRSDQQ
jgi:hypothetical protein